MNTSGRNAPTEVRRLLSWFFGTGFIVVVPLAFAIHEPYVAVTVIVACMMVGAGLGLYVHAADNRVTTWVRALPAPVLLAIMYPIAMWGTVTTLYIRDFEPEPTPQMVWNIGTLVAVWITVIGASLPDGSRWFKGFSFLFWLCFALTILIYGLGLIFVPMALAYGCAARQRAGSADAPGSVLAHQLGGEVDEVARSHQPTGSGADGT